jgi:hypothetical protein
MIFQQIGSDWVILTDIRTLRRERGREGEGRGIERVKECLVEIIN